MTIERYLKLIEQEIRKQKFGENPPSLYEPLRYIMSLGGKRLRPLYTLLSYSLYKKNVRDIIPIAVAMEVFHNFTLLHDDIMDQAPIRRGKPTVHEKWNINTAILSGDVMLVKVYQMLLKADPFMLPELIATFNQCATEVCEGQQWDMEFETQKAVSSTDYISMIRQKTAVLLGYCLELGALLAHASSKDRKALRDFGIYIGIGFQLKDDLLDVYGDHKKFGKRVGGDIVANKKTFLLLTALEKVKGKDRQTLRKWLNNENANPEKKVKYITSLYDQLEIRSATEKEIGRYFKKGFSKLNQLDVDPKQLDLLITFTQNLMNRQN